MKIDRYARCLALAFSVATLAACGGGHEAGEVTGTVAVGAPVQGAIVYLRDAGGAVRYTQSDASGAFKVAGAPEGALMVRCIGGQADGAPSALALHGLVLDGRVINCTPLTELALWRLLGTHPGVAFAAFDASTAKALTADTFAAAEATVLAGLAEGAEVDVDPAAAPQRWNRTPLHAGDASDAHDAALDALRQALTSQAALDLMGEMVLRGICVADNACD